MLRGEAPADDESLAVGVDGTLRALSSGRARGHLIGGNLSLVSALEGTPYAANTAGRILFLEDVGERPDGGVPGIRARRTPETPDSVFVDGDALSHRPAGLRRDVCDVGEPPGESAR